MYDPFTLHRLEPREGRDSYEVGTDSRWIGAAYLAGEYLFFPIEQLDIGYTFRVRAQPWFLFENVSIGPVIRYRWADTEANQAPTHGSLALQVLPTYVSSAERLVTQVRTQYHYALTQQWGLRGSIAYLQGSRFSDDYTPALVNDYYQYHSTVLAITTAYQLLAHDKHHLSLVAGPAYYWGARSYAENFFNAVNDETNAFYYNPEAREGDREYYGNLLMVVKRKRMGR